MALGVEPNEKDLMKRQPRNPKIGVITKLTWLIIFINSMLIAALAIAAYIISLYVLKFELQVARSMVMYISEIWYIYKLVLLMRLFGIDLYNTYNNAISPFVQC